MDPAQVDAAAAKLDGKQLEALAEMEHRRWAAVKWMTGWILGERDDKAKTHPNLVDYEALDEPTKQYDRDQISGTGNMLRALAASSKKINDK